MEEYFDVLNERGEFTWKIESREKCHKEGLWHKAVAIFIINSKKQVLLQKRSGTKKLWPNMWDITAGGHVLVGEFGFEAVIREIKEEIGVTLDKDNITLEKMKTLYKICKNNRDIQLLGYYIKNNLVGTLTLNILTLPSGKEATIWDLAIKEEYRRLGIATKLMNKAEEIAKKEKITKIWLFSGFHRQSAHELYRKLGYDENKDKAFIKQIN